MKRSDFHNVHTLYKMSYYRNKKNSESCYIFKNNEYTMNALFDIADSGKLYANILKFILYPQIDTNDKRL